MPSVTEVLSSCFLGSTGCRDPDLRDDCLSLCGHVFETEVAGQKPCYSLVATVAAPAALCFIVPAEVELCSFVSLA